MLRALSEGCGPLDHFAEAPDGPAVTRFEDALAVADIDVSAANQIVGEALGRELHKVLNRTGTKRAVVSDGGSSGFAIQQPGIFALTPLAPAIPGVSMFCAQADGPMNGLKLALKGAQMRTPHTFGGGRDGSGAR